MTFSDILKNAFFLLIFLQIVPSMFQSIRKQYSQILELRTQVAVLPIKGALSDSGYYTKYLTKYFKDPSIKAILIKMDCPGGAAGTGEAVYNELISLKNAPEYAKKPVITLVENVCASGGYYIACASDYIIAPGTSLIGSVGSTFPNIFFFQLHDFLAEHKIGYKPMAGGAYKNSIDPLSNMTPEQEIMLQELLDDSYDSFARDVAKSRKLSMQTKDTWANGRIFTGRQAKKLGLIDEIGSAYNAIKVIKEKALIEGDIEWIKPPTPSPLSQFFGGSTQPEDDTTLFSSWVNSICATIENRYLKNRLICS